MLQTLSNLSQFERLDKKKDINENKTKTHVKIIHIVHLLLLD